MRCTTCQDGRQRFCALQGTIALFVVAPTAVVRQ